MSHYRGCNPGTQSSSSPLIARFMGPTWDPSGADRTQVGPMLAPWTLLSGSSHCNSFARAWNDSNELQRLNYMIGYQDSCPSNDHQVTCSISFISSPVFWMVFQCTKYPFCVLDSLANVAPQRSLHRSPYLCTKCDSLYVYSVCSAKCWRRPSITKNRIRSHQHHHITISVS